jgi:very-short-patch-repair endonuclease
MNRRPKNYPFFIGAQLHTFQNANVLRESSTDSEKILRQKLKAKKLYDLKLEDNIPLMNL